jgi:hypothetical protein
MTLTDLRKLASTDEGRERIRVMVAEIQGAEPCRFHRTHHRREHECTRWECPIPIRRYTSSLDAMAECEAGLRGRDVEWYQHHLERVVFKFTTDDDWSEELGVSARTKPWHASALHRAMAYVLTKQPTKGADRE